MATVSSAAMSGPSRGGGPRWCPLVVSPGGGPWWWPLVVAGCNLKHRAMGEADDGEPSSMLLREKSQMEWLE